MLTSKRFKGKLFPVVVFKINALEMLSMPVPSFQLARKGISKLERKSDSGPINSNCNTRERMVYLFEYY
jgi:hypothetical protein